MVVWVFAGGGQAELKGLIDFLEKHFPRIQFERKTPVRQKLAGKPRPGAASQAGHGKTDLSLIRQLKQQLQHALIYQTPCDLILVIDDLDCKDAASQRQRFDDAINDVTTATTIQRIIAFAAPELESWIIADWNSSIAKHIDFRQSHAAMRRWLSADKKLSFDKPESFGDYNPETETCREKLSNVLIESTRQKGQTQYSKALHTPALLQMIIPETVQSKCPLFKQWFSQLKTLSKISA